MFSWIHSIVLCDSQTNFFSAFWRHKDTCTSWLPLSTACWYILLNLTMMTVVLLCKGRVTSLLNCNYIAKQQQNLCTNNNYNCTNYNYLARLCLQMIRKASTITQSLHLLFPFLHYSIRININISEATKPHLFIF